MMERVRVAAGVLRQADGRILLAQRPPGKIAAGRWEFPGGKIEAGETALQALTRELQEEIAVDVRQARPLLRLTHAYSERIVELDTWLVTQWAGSPVGLEQQALSWCSPSQTEAYDILEADKPILDALQLPTELPVSGAFSSLEELLNRAQKLFSAGHRVLRFRAEHLNDEGYQGHLSRLLPLAAAYDAVILLDRLACFDGTDAHQGLHLRAADLFRRQQRPCSESQWLLASVHNATEIQMAQAVGANALVLGHVQATASHPGQAPLGWDGFAELVGSANVPVYAIGGLSHADLPAIWQAGGQGVAGIGAYW